MPETSVHIRYATAADAALLAEVGARTFYDSFAADNTPENMAAYLAASFSPEKQASELSEPGTVFLIAEVEGTTAGYAKLRASPPLPGITGERPLELVRIYSLKEWIGHGIGPALMQACLQEAEKRGCDTLWLDVWEQNVRARAFYRKWGFVEVGTNSFQLGDDLQNDLLMQRPVIQNP
jgi:ribosomal protein S18 acetylase RimI-like enzyme